MKWLSHQNCNCVLNLQQVAQREPEVYLGKRRFCFDLYFPQFPAWFLLPSREIWMVIRSTMASIMWLPSHIPLIHLEIHSEPLLKLSIATTFPQSVYAQIHQHHLMCPAVQGHSASSLLYNSLSSTTYINTSAYPPSLLDKLSPQHFLSLPMSFISSLSFSLLIIGKGSAYYFWIK